MQIYKPAEDSYLLSKVLKKSLPNLIKNKPSLKFLEIGAGSGVHLETALNLGVERENIFSCDVNPDAVSNCRILGFNCIYSDLFEGFPEGSKYEIIIFNPPYLPEDKNYPEPEDSKLSTTGGKKGSEIIIRFLNQAKDHLESDGKIFLITSSLAEEINFNDYGFKSVKLASEKLFFEKLFCWELTL